MSCLAYSHLPEAIVEPRHDEFVKSWCARASGDADVVVSPGEHDDFVIGMEQFGTRILPLMRCREKYQMAAE